MLQIIPQELALSIIALLETSDILNLRQVHTIRLTAS